MAFLELKNISKSYGQGAQTTSVLKNVNLQIQEGEFVAIVGFSGSGKTTLINTIAGLVQPDEGHALMQGKPIEEPGPERGLVFQSYSLLPWLSVYDNVALAVNQVHKGWSKEQRSDHIHKYVNMVGLSHAMNRKPAELSGGMRQRVAVARALAMNPEVLLLDEPLSALDALTRANLQSEIERIWHQENKTVLLITNDIDEGLLLADRIIPLTPGPDATLGPEFVISLERPRDRTEVNHDPEFKRLRKEITQYLMQVGMERPTENSQKVIHLPKVLPNTQKDYQKGLPGGAISHENLGQEGYVEFSQLVKTYPTPKGPLVVVDGFDLKVKKGEFISLIGHSGCGKSTVLSMTAGLNEITNGGIILDDKEVVAAGPDRGVVFQAPSLFPWMTAFDNVMLGVDKVYPHAKKKERHDIVTYYLNRVGLGDILHRKASALSNGQKQRVGIARAFALSPKLLLLDEPFGMLDSLTRIELQEVLMEVWARTQVTAVIVTHDVDEAILLADRVVMMTNGPHAKVGKVLEIDLPRPRSRKSLLEHPDYYWYREELLNFLEECEHGKNPTSITSKKQKIQQMSQQKESLPIAG